MQTDSQERKTLDKDETHYGNTVQADYREYDSDPEYLIPLARLVKLILKRRNKVKPKYYKVSKNRKLRMKDQDYLGYRRPRNQEQSKVFHDTQRSSRKIKEACNSGICKKSTKRLCNAITEEERLAQFEKFCKDMN